MIYSKVLRGQLRWFEAVNYLARTGNALTRAEYGCRGHRRENNLEKIDGIAHYVLSRPQPSCPMPNPILLNPSTRRASGAKLRTSRRAVSRTR